MNSYLCTLMITGLADGKEILLLPSLPGLVLEASFLQLLDRLAENYEPPKVDRRRRGRVSDLEAALRDILAVSEREGFKVVGRGDRVYAAFPGSETSGTLYTSDLDAALSRVEVEETRCFPDIEVLETDEETVFFDARRRDDFLWTSPLETYFLLAAGGKRELQKELCRPTRRLSAHDIRLFLVGGYALVLKANVIRERELSFLLLKLFAFDDRKDDPDMDEGRHHAFDLSR